MNTDVVVAGILILKVIGIMRKHKVVASNVPNYLNEVDGNHTLPLFRNFRSRNIQWKPEEPPFTHAKVTESHRQFKHLPSEELWALIQCPGLNQANNCIKI